MEFAAFHAQAAIAPGDNPEIELLQLLICRGNITVQLGIGIEQHVCYLSGLKNKYMSFELMGESIAYETKLSIIELIKKWSS